MKWWFLASIKSLYTVTLDYATLIMASFMLNFLSQYSFPSCKLSYHVRKSSNSNVMHQSLSILADSINGNFILATFFLWQLKLLLEASVWVLQQPFILQLVLPLDDMVTVMRTLSTSEQLLD